MQPSRLVLASASPRRRELLARLGLAVEVRPADIDEAILPGETPEGLVARLARAKARAIALEGAWVLGADTVVVLDDEILGKPVGRAEAGAMLAALSGREHRVVTGCCLVGPDRVLASERVVSTGVWFRVLPAVEIEAYLASGEWDGKAGGYAIQGIAAMFARELHGSWSNVVGLPLCEVVEDLYRLGVVEALPVAGSW